jgi:hypothetical protein
MAASNEGAAPESLAGPAALPPPVCIEPGITVLSGSGGVVALPAFPLGVVSGGSSLGDPQPASAAARNIDLAAKRIHGAELYMPRCLPRGELAHHQIVMGAHF